MIALSQLSRRRLVALFLLVSIVPLAALAYLVMTISTNAVASRANQSLSLSASLNGLYIGEQVQSLEEIVSSFAHEPDFVAAVNDGNPAHYDRRVIDATLKQLSRVRPGIAGALLVTPDGQLGDQFPFEVNLGSQPGFNSSDWVQMVRGSLTSYVSPIYTSGASGSPKVTGIAAPVNEVAGDGTTGPLLGIIAIEYSISNVADFSQRFASNEGVLVTVEDQRGALLAAAETNLAAPDRAALAAARQGSSGLIQTSGADAELIAYAPIPRVGWGVTAEIAASNAFADVDTLRFTVIAFAVPLGLVLIIGAWLLNRTLRFWQRAEAEVRRLAAVDPLTGIYNRRSWDEQLARELARARREHRPLSVAMIDLDHFKRFNDQNGHPAGDRLLAETAAVWRSTIRATDVLARYGGEEFAAALPDCPLDQAIGIMERLGSVMPMGQTLSAGVACWDGVESASALMARADRALYLAKEQGRNRVIIADEAIHLAA